MRKYANLFLKDLAATKYFVPIFIFIGNTLCSVLILTPLKALQKVISDNTWMASTNPFENVFDIIFVGMFFVLLSFFLLNFQQRWSITKTKNLITKKQLVISKYIYWFVFASYLLISLMIFLKIYGYLSKENILPIFLLFYAMFTLFTALFVPLSFFNHLLLIIGLVTFSGLALLAKPVYHIMNNDFMKCFNQLFIFLISSFLITSILSGSMFLSMKIVKYK
jgi:hypothetical protein